MQRIVLMLVLVLASFSSFAQFKVGRSKEEIKADKDKATPKLIGAKYTALTIDFGLYAVGDSTEFLKYITKGALNSEIHETITFTSLQEESDFYQLCSQKRDGSDFFRNQKFIRCRPNASDSSVELSIVPLNNV